MSFSRVRTHASHARTGRPGTPAVTHCYFTRSALTPYGMQAALFDVDHGVVGRVLTAAGVL